MPELKPVAWMWEYRGFTMVTASDGQAAMLKKDPDNKVTPLYAIPEQVKAQWQAHDPDRVYVCFCTECINLPGNEGDRAFIMSPDGDTVAVLHQTRRPAR